MAAVRKRASDVAWSHAAGTSPSSPAFCDPAKVGHRPGGRYPEHLGSAKRRGDQQRKTTIIDAPVCGGVYRRGSPRHLQITKQIEETTFDYVRAARAPVTGRRTDCCRDQALPPVEMKKPCVEGHRPVEGARGSPAWPGSYRRNASKTQGGNENRRRPSLPAASGANQIAAAQIA